MFGPGNNFPLHNIAVGPLYLDYTSTGLFMLPHDRPGLTIWRSYGAKYLIFNN